LSPRLEEAEALFAERFPTGAIEPMKHAFNRAVGLCFNALHPETTVAFDDPEISFVIDIEGDELAMNVGSIYLFGRYRKLVRGIPQTRWPCRRCRGRGCASCGGTGKQYPESVEEWIAAPFVEASAAAGQRFHGAGREDIDARMLGDGRPFVLELVAPRVRELDLAGLREEANRRAAGRVETSELRIVRRAAVEFVKERKAAKRYRARVEFAGDVSPGDLRSALEGLTGEVAQRTPRRVAHRRADKVRRRRLMGASVANSISPRAAEIEFATEGGLYVKELVSGDDGRTEPSLAARLGLGARVTELDVLEIAWPRDREGRLDIPFALP
jgi:tRNA pseudouridine synthase 10